MIPDEAVEAAAKSLADIADPLGEWDNQAAPYRNWYKRQAEAILEAASQHMLAEAWDEGWRGGYNTKFAKFSLNPYRPAP